MATKLFVGNLPFSATENDLQDYFATAGTVIAVNIMQDRATGRSRGFAFIEMGSQAEADAAISQFHGKEFQGRALTVNEARPREERPPAAAAAVMAEGAAVVAVIAVAVVAAAATGIAGNFLVFFRATGQMAVALFISEICPGSGCRADPGRALSFDAARAPRAKPPAATRAVWPGQCRVRR